MVLKKLANNNSLAGKIWEICKILYRHIFQSTSSKKCKSFFEISAKICLHQVEKKLKLRKSFKKKSDPDDVLKPIERKTRFWEHQPKKVSSWKISMDQSLLRKKTLLRCFCGRLKTSMENTNRLCSDRRKKNSYIDFLNKKQTFLPTM